MKRTNLNNGISSHIILIVIIVYYFQMLYYHNTIRLLGGYVIKNWMPVFLLLYLLLIKRSMYHANVKIEKSHVYIYLLIFLYILGISFSLFLNEGGLKILRYAFHMTNPVILFLIIQKVYEVKKMQKVLKALFLIGVFLSLYVILIYSTNLKYKFPAIQTNIGAVGELTSAIFIEKEGSVTNRWTVPGIGPNSYGIMLVPIIFFGFYFYKNCNGINKYFYGLSTILLFYCLNKTLSLGAMLSFGFGLLYLLWKKWFTFKQCITVGLCLILILCFNPSIVIRGLRMFSFIPFLSNSDLFGTVGKSNLTDMYRYLTIKDSLNRFAQNPLFGMGFESLTVRQLNEFGHYEHNHYISLLASHGLVSFIPYIVIILLLYMKLNKLLKKSRIHRSLCDLGIILGASLLSLIININFSPSEFPYYWILFGFTAVWIKDCEKKHYRFIENMKEKKINVSDGK